MSSQLGDKEDHTKPPFITLNTQSGTYNVITGTVVTEVKIRDNGQCSLLETSFTKASAICLFEFLKETPGVVIYAAPSGVALSNFLDNISAPLGGVWESLPQLRVQISLLDKESFPEAVKLDEFVPTEIAHGYELGVYEHFKERMDAVQVLPRGFLIDVVLYHPWRDYRKLHWVTEPLRQHGRRFRLRLQLSAWRRVPQRDFHIALTAAAFEGKKGVSHMLLDGRPSITEDDAEELVLRGCRGFRAWKAGEE